MDQLFKHSFLCVVLALLGAACGGSDTPVESTGTGGDGIINTTGGLLSGGGGTTTTGGSAATGGSASGTGGTATTDAGIFQPATCDTTVVAATTCGSETCQAPGGGAAMFRCTTPCCVDDGSGTMVCGTLDAIEGAVTACMLPPPPPVPDPLCPSSMDNNGNVLEGCCTTDNSGADVCGTIQTSNFGGGGTTCRVPRGGRGGGGQTMTYPCDGSGLTPDPDAGM